MRRDGVAQRTGDWGRQDLGLLFFPSTRGEIGNPADHKHQGAPYRAGIELRNG
jgi:hypothetical protein